MAELSIVIVTFNSIAFIKPCLDSVINQDYRDFEVIVIDNGSQDGTADFIETNFPRAILIRNSKNLGAAKARNQGIENAKGGLIMTLDCDVELEKGFLRQMAGLAGTSQERIAIFQPKILYADKKTIYSCGIFLSGLRRFYDIGKGEADRGQFNTSVDVFGACCAAAVYKRRMLEEVREDSGYFDERFFFLAEDVDLAWRARKKGWKAAYFPEPVCYHSGGSSGFHAKFRQYLCFRNRYFAILKNDNIGFLLKLPYLLLTYDLPRMLYLLFSNRYTTKALKEIIGFNKSSSVL